MNSRIKQYIEYEFRNINKDYEVIDAMNEAYDNILERYQNLIDEGYEEEDAYLKAVSRLGDYSSNFQKQEKEEKTYALKEWRQATLTISSVLAWLSLPAIAINIYLMLFLLLASLISFAVGAAYEISTAKVALEQKKNVEKHNSILKQIFIAYTRLRFAWIISIGYVCTYATYSILVALLSLNVTTKRFITIVGDIYGSYIVLIILFILLASIFIMIFTGINKNIFNKYLALTSDSTTIIKIKQRTKDALLVKAPLVFTPLYILLIPFAFLADDGKTYSIPDFFLIIMDKQLDDPLIYVTCGIMVFTLILSLLTLIFKITRKYHFIIDLLHIGLYMIFFIALTTVILDGKYEILFGYYAYTSVVIIQLSIIITGLAIRAKGDRNDKVK